MKNSKLMNFSIQELQKEIESRQYTVTAPTVREDIDWSKVKAMAEEIVATIVNGNYHEDNDEQYYIWELVLKTVYGDDFFTWYNKATK